MLPGLINPNRNQKRTDQPPVPSQNLLNQASFEDVTRAPGFYASIGLDFAAILTALLAGLNYKFFLAGKLGLWPVLAAAALFLCVSVFSALLKPSMGRRSGVILAELAAILAPFYDLPAQYLLPAGLAAGLFLLWGDIGTDHVMKNILELKFFQVIKPKLNRTITALALLAVLLYLPQWKAEESFLDRHSFSSVYAWSTTSVNRFYGELEFDGTFDRFMESMIRLQFAGNTTFSQLLPSAKQRIVDEEKVKLLAELQVKLDMQIDPKTSTQEVAYRYLIRLFEGWRNEFGNRFLLFWAVGAFFLLRGFGFLFYAVVAAVSYFICQALIALNILKMSGEARLKETLEYT